MKLLEGSMVDSELLRVCRFTSCIGVLDSKNSVLSMPSAMLAWLLVLETE